MCMHACEWCTHMSVPVNMHAEVQEGHLVSSFITLYFMTVLNRWVGQWTLRNHLCLCPNAGVTSMCNHAQLFTWVLGTLTWFSNFNSKHSYSLNHLSNPPKSVFFSTDRYLIPSSRSLLIFSSKFSVSGIAPIEPLQIYTGIELFSVSQREYREPRSWM